MAEKGRRNMSEAAGKSGNGSKSTPAMEANKEYAAIYLDNYIDCLHDLPNDIQRNMSRMQELNVDYAECWTQMGGVIKDLLNQIDNPGNERSGSRDFINGIGTLNSIMGKMNVMHVQQEKLQIAETIFETIENKARQLSLDKKNLDESEKAVIAENQQKVATEVSAPANSSQKVNEMKSERVVKSGIKRLGKGKKDLSPIKLPSTPKQPTTVSKPSSGKKKPHGGARSSGSSVNTSPTSQGLVVKYPKESIAIPPPSKPPPKKVVSFVIKKKRGYGFVKRKGATKKFQPKENANIQWQQMQQQQMTADQTAEIPGADIEPLYCLCSQVSYGEMICCDNELCPIEWFHFGCVQLARKPRGNWYCPRCRDGKATLMKQRSILIKELEAYNREREAESNAKQPE